MERRPRERDDPVRNRERPRRPATYESVGKKKEFVVRAVGLDIRDLVVDIDARNDERDEQQVDSRPVTRNHRTRAVDDPDRTKKYRSREEDRVERASKRDRHPAHYYRRRFRLLRDACLMAFLILPRFRDLDFSFRFRSRFGSSDA